MWSNKNGKLRLNDFTYRNIIGRGGRMFRHFIGNIYILERPPAPADTQLDLTFPDELLAEVDEQEFRQALTKDQIAKILLYKEEMAAVLGQEVFERLKEEGALISGDTTLITEIALEISRNRKSWRGLAILNSASNEHWAWILYKVLRLAPGDWEAPYTKFVEFVRTLTYNWTCSIPELLDQLDEQDVTIEQFFKLERNATFKLTALLSDINVLQKEILAELHLDISPFIAKLSKAFLPSCVLELEEYGLPRMLTKKLHTAKILNFEDEGLTLHAALEALGQIPSEKIAKTAQLDDFDRYVLEYFLEGIARH